MVRVKCKSLPEMREDDSGDSAKLPALRAKTCSRSIVPCVLTCSRSNVSCVLTCSRANVLCVLMCQCVLRIYMMLGKTWKNV